MTDKTTGAMQEYTGPTDPGAPGEARAAGLVLLYAEAYEQLPPAWRFTKRKVRIGSGEDADVQIAVNAVSRTHAEFAWKDNGWIIRDLESRNGTLVDGVRVDMAVMDKFPIPHPDRAMKWRDIMQNGCPERRLAAGNRIPGIAAVDWQRLFHGRPG